MQDIEGGYQKIQMMANNKIQDERGNQSMGEFRRFLLSPVGNAIKEGPCNDGENGPQSKSQRESAPESSNAVDPNNVSEDSNPGRSGCSCGRLREN